MFPEPDHEYGDGNSCPKVLFTRLWWAHIFLPLALILSWRVLPRHGQLRDNDLLAVFRTRWSYHQCGDDHALQEAQLFCQVCWELSVLGHCQDIVAAFLCLALGCAPALREAIVWVLLCTLLQLLISSLMTSAICFSTWLCGHKRGTAVANATGQGLSMGSCSCWWQLVVQGCHLSTGEKPCQARLATVPYPHHTGDVVWLCLPHVHPALPQSICPS